MMQWWNGYSGFSGYTPFSMMNGYNSGFGFAGSFFGLIALAAVWDLVWKGLGLWRAAQRKEGGWFVAILLLNTLGILPILYLYVFSKPDADKKKSDDK